MIKELDIANLHTLIENNPDRQFELDISLCKLIANNQSWNICLEKGSSEMLLSGEWDATSILISQKSKIQSLAHNLPYLKNFN